MTNQVFEELVDMSESFKSGKNRFNYGPGTSTAGKKLANFDKSRTAAGKAPIFKKQENDSKKETMKEGIILSFSEEAIRALRESDEQQKRMLQLIRTGIVPRSDVSKMILALNNAKDDKALTKQQKDMLIDLLSKLSDFVTGDNAVFTKAKMAAVGMRD